MVSTTKSTTVNKTLIGLRRKITRLNGVINPEGVDKLEDKLGGMCTIIKTHHHTEGQNTATLPASSHRTIIGL
jgi:hypothetical protein